MTDNVSVKFNDKAFLSAMQKAPVEVSEQVDLAVNKATQQTADKLREAAPKAFSTLTNSIKADKIGHFEYRAAPHVNYAESVELGRLPGKIPNVEEISRWAKIKGLETNGRSFRDVGWAIAKSIGKIGTQAQPFVKPVVDSGFPQRKLNQLANAGVQIGLAKAGF